MRIACGELKAYQSHINTRYTCWFFSCKTKNETRVRDKSDIYYYFPYCIVKQMLTLGWVLDSRWVKCLCVRRPHVVCVIYTNKHSKGQSTCRGQTDFKCYGQFTHAHLHTRTHTHAAQLSIKCRLKHSSSASKLSCATNMHELNVPQKSEPTIYAAIAVIIVHHPSHAQKLQDDKYSRKIVTQI